jgi:hypothetical protein
MAGKLFRAVGVQTRQVDIGPPTRLATLVAGEARAGKQRRDPTKVNQAFEVHWDTVGAKEVVAGGDRVEGGFLGSYQPGRKRHGK